MLANDLGNGPWGRHGPIFKAMAGKPFTDNEIQYIRDNYPDQLTMTIANELGRTERSIYRMATVLDIHKSKEYKQGMVSGKFVEMGHGSRFGKGSIPWNKGIKCMPIKAKGSLFADGHRPWQTKYDGCISERIDAEGRIYKYIRIELRKWIPLHVKNWMDVNGPVPVGHIVIFKDASAPDRERIENLELISRQENLYRNRLHQYPKDLQGVIKLKNKLQKILKNGTKNNP